MDVAFRRKKSNEHNHEYKHSQSEDRHKDLLEKPHNYTVIWFLNLLYLLVRFQYVNILLASDLFNNFLILLKLSFEIICEILHPFCHPYHFFLNLCLFCLNLLLLLVKIYFSKCYHETLANFVKLTFAYFVKVTIRLQIFFFSSLKFFLSFNFTGF
jgi:hypothetical protein